MHVGFAVEQVDHGEQHDMTEPCRVGWPGQLYVQDFAFPYSVYLFLILCKSSFRDRL